MPLGRVLGVAPGRAAQLDHLGGDILKCGNGGGRGPGGFTRLPLLDDWVPPLSHGGTICVGYFPGPSKANRVIRSQAYVPPSSINHNPLHPWLGARGSDVEVKAVPVAVPARCVECLGRENGELAIDSPITTPFPTLSVGFSWILGELIGRIKSTVSIK